MLRLQAIIFLASLVLTLYTFIECARRDESKIKKLPKWGWLLLIVLLSPFSAIAYLIIGRVRGERGPRQPKRRILPPDDDPDFLRKL
jgi:membrane protein implicated in regulation of membrane protease activity